MNIIKDSLLVGEINDIAGAVDGLLMVRIGAKSHGKE